MPDVDDELVELAHEFAEREMRPHAARYDETGDFPWEIVHKAAEAGLTSYDLPERYGGGGVHSLLTCARIFEELAWGDAPMAGCISGGSFFAGPILAMGTEQQQERWVTPLCGERPPIGALATTEPEVGSDAAAMSSHARREGDGYVLNGQKTWISNAPVADLYLVFATVAPGTRSKGITAFVLERGDPGFEIGRKLPKMGARCYPAGELFFDDCPLALDRRIGNEGQGFYGVMRWFDVTRVQLAANSVGIGRAALEYAVEYAKQRRAFGKTIHEFQAVSFRLVDAKLKLDQARLMAHHAARLADAGKPFSTEASMAKLAASEAAWFAAWACCQTLGGYSYSTEYPAERWLRNAKLEELYEGTNDIQRLIISRGMFR
jgi:acyl-CoA dehydrogenase